MSTENQSSQSGDKWLVIAVLVALSFVVAWPAVLVGAVVRLLIKYRATYPQLTWLLAGCLGVGGAIVLYLRANPYPLFLVLMQDIIPLALHWSITTVKHFLTDAFPLWERSLLVSPLFSLVIELCSPKSLEEKLLSQEQQRRALQTSKSKRAARRVRTAPEQINGKGVLGAVIDNPNTYQ